MIYLDTHVLIRLAMGDPHKLGSASRKAIESHELLTSAAAVLELEMLHEIGRLKMNSERLVATLAASLGLRVCDLPFRVIVEHALSETWAHDPFDRLIVANAKASRAALVTKDERILSHYSRAVW